MADVLVDFKAEHTAYDTHQEDIAKDTMSNHQHTSTIYQTELEDLRTAVLKMGGKVESQLRQAVLAFSESDKQMAEQVLEVEREVNRDHLNIDGMCSEIIALRQPAASDLRMLLGMVRTVSDLERIGDEASKIAKMALNTDPSKRGFLPRLQTIFQSADLAAAMLRSALDAFAREDTSDSRQIFASDLELDELYKAIVRQLITFMMEDPRTISAALDDLWVAKAIERIGDHAENIAENAIYIIEGEDVRYTHNS